MKSSSKSLKERKEQFDNIIESFLHKIDLMRSEINVIKKQIFVVEERTIWK